MIVQSDKYASESTHWYQQNGTPAYTIIGKNGNERPTTLRDARTLSLVPSVTTILKVAASPGLERWKQDQILMAALTLPRVDGESESEYMTRIRQDAAEQGRKAAERGTEIHGYLEAWYRDYYTDQIEIVLPVNDKVVEVFGEQEWMPEKSFAHPIGFAGKVDLHSPEVVIDFKTTGFTEDKLPSKYPDKVMQLAAYRNGLGFENARCANVYVSTTVPGLVHIIEYDEEELKTGFKKFMCLLDFWYLSTGMNR